MKRVMIICLTGVMILAISNMVQAAIYSVGPSSLSGDMSTGFGWDYDMEAPIAVNTEGTLTGDSFWSNVSATSTTRKYTAFRFTVQAVGFAEGTTLNDISSFKYDSKLVSGNMDWRVNIYTVKQTDTTTGWYGSRISYNYNTSPTGNWITNDLATLGVYSVRSNGNEYYSGQSGFDAAFSAASNQVIWFIDIIAGANSPATDVDAYLDNIQLSGNNVVAQINLVPEPATMLLLGLGGLLLRKVRA